jgi:hypothetical protein
MYKSINVENVENFEIIEYLLKVCKNRIIYYVHNLTFEIYVFLPYLIKYGVKFKLISYNKIIYAAELTYKNKKIIFRCSYRLTMLSLKELALLSEIKEKTIFPYKILTEDLKDTYFTTLEMFENEFEKNEFEKIYGNFFNTYEILEEYCKNDA